MEGQQNVTRIDGSRFYDDKYLVQVYDSTKFLLIGILSNPRLIACRTVATFTFCPTPFHPSSFIPSLMKLPPEGARWLVSLRWLACAAVFVHDVADFIGACM